MSPLFMYTYNGVQIHVSFPVEETANMGSENKFGFRVGVKVGDWGIFGGRDVYYLDMCLQALSFGRSLLGL